MQSQSYQGLYSELNIPAMRIGPGKHLKGRKLMGGIITPEQFDQIPVGTGSFQFVDYQKDAVIRFKAFDGWAGKPKVDDLIYASTPDSTARYAKLKANECQVMGYRNPADLADMAKNPDVEVLRQAGLNIGYMAMNVQ